MNKVSTLIAYPIAVRARFPITRPSSKAESDVMHAPMSKTSDLQTWNSTEEPKFTILGNIGILNLCHPINSHVREQQQLDQHTSYS